MSDSSVAGILDDESQPVVHVDDDENTLFLVKSVYAKSELKNPFLSFTGGEQLFEYLNAVETDGKPVPGLLLLDINMPVMNGFEVLKKIRSNKKFKDIPVCSMLTSSAQVRDRQMAIENGANGYLIKPDNVTDFIAFFNSLRKKD